MPPSIYPDGSGGESSDGDFDPVSGLRGDILAREEAATLIEQLGLARHKASPICVEAWATLAGICGENEQGTCPMYCYAFGSDAPVCVALTEGLDACFAKKKQDAIVCSDDGDSDYEIQCRHCDAELSALTTVCKLPLGCSF